MKKFLFFLFTSLLICSCNNTKLYFDQPQPQHKKALSKIAKSLCGTYVSKEKSALLVQFDLWLEAENEIGDFQQLNQEIEINENEILNKIDGTVYIPSENLRDGKKELSPKTLMDSLILNFFYAPNYAYQFLGEKNEQLVYTVQMTDTMYKQNSNDFLKKWQGYYFLNKEKSRGWATFSLEKTANELIIGNIDHNGKALMKVLNENDISQPTKRHMKAFLKQNGFSKKFYLSKNN